MANPAYIKSYFVLERLMLMAEDIRADCLQGAKHYAAIFEVDVRTITRYRDYLRERLGYEFEYDHRAARWRTISVPDPKL